MLGFTQTGYYPIASEPIRTEVRRDDVAIILYTEAIHAADRPPAFTGALYIFPENIDRLADELRGKVPFAWGPEDNRVRTSANSPSAIRTATRWCSPNGRER